MRVRMPVALVSTLALAAATPGAAPAATGYVVDGCSCDNTVTVIDSATRSAIATITVGDGVSGIAVARDGSAAYTANVLDQSISVIDGRTHALAHEFPLGPDDLPIAPAVAPDGRTLYVLIADAITSDPAIAVVDLATAAITERIPLAGSVFLPGVDVQLAISPDGTSLYTTNLFGQVWWVHLPTSTATDITPAAASDPTGVAVAPNGRVYVSDAGEQLFVLDPTGAQVDMIALPDPAGGAPLGIALDAAGATAWVSGTPLDEASAVDTATGAAQPTTGIGDLVVALAVSPDDDGVFLVSATDDVVYVVDPRTRARVATIPVDGPTVIAFGPATPRRATLARPVVTAVTPPAGPTAGGQEVTIAGANFGSARHVLFGDTPSPAFRVTGFNTIVATVPPSAEPAGVAVRVVGPDGQHSTEPVTYRYEHAPASAPGPAPGDGPSTAPVQRPACVVPDVRGHRLRGARKRLKAAHCTVGTVTRIRHRRHQRVVRQSIEPGTTKPHGWGVALAIRPRSGR